LLNGYDGIEEREFLELNNRYFNKLKGYDDSSKDLLETIKSLNINQFQKNLN
jgi:CRISPR-associated endonuclease/helicase Cas3